MKKKSFLWLGLLVFFLFLGTSIKSNALTTTMERMRREFCQYMIKESVWCSLRTKKAMFQNEEWFCWPIYGEKKWKMYAFGCMEEEKTTETLNLHLVESENKKKRTKELLVIEEISGDTSKEEQPSAKETKGLRKKNPVVEELKATKDSKYLLNNFYIVDSTTSVDYKIFDVDKFLNTDYSIEKKDAPQILIYHTHGGTEYYAEGEQQKYSIIKAGEYLEQQLEHYGYQVVHDQTKYDYVNGKMDRNKAYTQALKGVTKILEDYPSIEVVIDLHRDASNGTQRRVTKINGENVAQFMIFNGLSRNPKGEIAYLYNPFLQDNLAFGLQMKIRAMELYPDLTIKNYLKGYRYNMHLMKRFLLIELGNENNQMEEVERSIQYMGEIINDVLSE